MYLKDFKVGDRVKGITNSDMSFTGVVTRISITYLQIKISFNNNNYLKGWTCSECDDGVHSDDTKGSLLELVHPRSKEEKIYQKLNLK